MIRERLTEKARDVLTQRSSHRCIDYLHHEFFCHHPGRVHGLNWSAKDGCSGDVCIACYYAPGGPASWDDLKLVQAVLKRERAFMHHLLRA